MMTKISRPFLAYGAERLEMEAGEPPPRRYNEAHSLSEIFLNGRWVRALDAPSSILPQTRKSAVGQETTDDE